MLVKHMKKKMYGLRYLERVKPNEAHSGGIGGPCWSTRVTFPTYPPPGYQGPPETDSYIVTDYAFDGYTGYSLSL
jgi:hypothetical protein